MSKSTFERAIVHQTKQIEKYERLVEGNTQYLLQLKSAKVSLAALLMVRDFQCEDILMKRVNDALSIGPVAQPGERLVCIQ